MSGIVRRIVGEITEKRLEGEALKRAIEKELSPEAIAKASPKGDE